MTPKEIINVVAAYENGKKIEYREKNSNTIWIEAIEPLWNFAALDFRVKEKEKELYQYLIHNPQTNLYRTTYKFYENSFDVQSELTSNWKIIQRLNYTKVIIKEE
ncbi:MAG: hypothetical protein IPK44_24275 [Candidatus Accumulibacter sp.]|uniref:hypothetical protein n=1 Tax=Accumulibacter sp. TaxID=2053492 RepID=UPI0025839B2B|nr:hypothetical protein [Accumulibacter sp.]MBK8117407.1 hypothetical protein [Accumulibacter sp.]